jgi:hypothetical protein
VTLHNSFVILCLVSEKIQCSVHGEREATFVCHHLLGDSVAFGFNHNEPTRDNHFPDAWCDNCEIIRVAHDGWNEESEKLTKITMICSGCYNRSRIRNTHPSTTLDDLAQLRWKCSSCEEWHTGPCLDFSYQAPIYWEEKHEEANRRTRLLPSWTKKRSKTFLDKDFCSIDDEYFFIRGLISLPIIGSSEHFVWSVWGSLSKDNFNLLREKDDDPKRTDLSPMFSWLSNRIQEYPDTLNIKMYAHIQPLHTRPEFELEHTDHPLAQQYHHGITPERVKEIMMNRLKGNE